MQHRSFQFSVGTGTSTAYGGDRATSALAVAPSPHTAESLATYAARWLAGVRGAVRARTFESYSSQLRLHVLPRLGDVAIDELDVDDVLGLIDELRAAGYTAWTIRTVLTPLSRLLNHAV